MAPHTLIGEQLKVEEIGREGFDAWTILHGLGDLLGKGGGIDASASRAGAGLRLVLGDDELEGRQIHDLTSLGRRGSDFVERGSTVLADLGMMHDGGVGFFGEFERAPRMAGLPSGFAVASAALGFGLLV